MVAKAGSVSVSRNRLIQTEDSLEQFLMLAEYAYEQVDRHVQDVWMNGERSIRPLHLQHMRWLSEKFGELAEGDLTPSQGKFYSLKIHS